MGFRLNKYDPCVANKVINDHQCTITWYVDDSKISHVDGKVVSKVIQEIEESFGEMSVKRGKQHTFVGMDFELKDDGSVSISMKDYLIECINSFGESFNGGASTPARTTLFDIKEGELELDEKRKEVFHHIVAKLLFVSKRARPDIDLTVSFLCARVDKSTEEDWSKLRRLLHYINGTLDLKRVISMNDMLELRTWVDASYGVHQDMRGHTGGVMSLGRGTVHHKTAKQKLNTKSSTESELVGASDYLPHTVWLKRFLQGQGYKLNRNIYYQDNQSAIKLESNGFGSRGEKSRHINIRYFFIKDILQKEDIELKHCRTEKMVADYFTKPLQGRLFKLIRDYIMGQAQIPMEERVRENNQNDNKRTPNKISIGTEDASGNKISMTYAEVVKNQRRHDALKGNETNGRNCFK